MAMLGPNKFSTLWLLMLALPLASSAADTNYFALSNQIHSIEENIAQLDAKVSRQLNELSWFQRLSDVAFVDKVNFTGPPPKDTNNLPSPDRKSTRLNSSHIPLSRMPSSA